MPDSNDASIFDTHRAGRAARRRSGASALARWLARAAFCGFAAACGGGGSPSDATGNLGGGDPVNPVSAPLGEGASTRKPFAAPSCSPPLGLPVPNGIAAVVDWINALPKPLSLPCFLETLLRPVELYASQSMFSAQPAVGWRSPRMFLFADELVMSISPDGIGQDLLEFGERRPSNRSLEGEIHFPVEVELPPSAPYDHVLVGSNTSCSACHGDEYLDPTIPFASAYISTAFRPVPAERVGLDELQLEARDCDALAEPARCEMLIAIFGQGHVVDAEFPATLDTFY